MKITIKKMKKIAYDIITKTEDYDEQAVIHLSINGDWIGEKDGNHNHPGIIYSHIDPIESRMYGWGEVRDDEEKKRPEYKKLRREARQDMYADIIYFLQNPI